MFNTLFSLSWWRKMINGVSVADLHQRWAQIVAVFHNPRINPIMFLMIIAVIVIAVLIIVLTVVMIAAALSRRERYALADGSDSGTVLDDENVKARAVRSYRRSWKLYSTVLFVIAGAFLLLLCVGFGTSASSYCKACHHKDKKIAVMQSGAHKDLTCVRCHEGGGTIARYTTNSFQRIGHLLTGIDGSHPTGYSTVPAGACMNCHNKKVSSTFVATNLGDNHISMSHTGLQAASMPCSRCHNMTTARSPVALPGTMNTCLICHNGKTAADACTTCHVNTPRKTIVSSGPSPDNADLLVTANPRSSCYTCHAKDAARCDGCHGLRIPHPDNFESGHPTAVLLYGLNTCMRCHDKSDKTPVTPGRAGSCSQCHGQDSKGRWDFQGFLDSDGGRNLPPVTHEVYIEETGQRIQVPGRRP
ncbi:MAG: hypothetical protein FWC54_03485 [Actinomycetia bacterium]|nr:hypothetical protein [Actinomycetes bacterium]